ncbi:Rne/Rng family ribonuclease [Paracoccus alkanivorans]|uniref:Ribonuclease E n=1 Tax=Paracoccus alkanivorans TaxID=2116655 RepID=A0A3M0M6T4_9RHOB|nr:Rne/Rng family ribonuclease [Paracoccus alkanivorans]RMC33319.1 ribonuclease E/G [Paracoccus alkanivorans]
MAKKMLIDATHAEETRVVVVDGTKVEEFDFETVNKRQISGNIYLAKVTRVEPSLQAAFVDYGGNRHGFLAFAEIHPDYYQIPAADRDALIAEEQAYAEAQEAEESSRGSKRRRSSSKAAKAQSDDETVSAEAQVDDAGDDKSAGDTGDNQAEDHGAEEADASDKDDSIESVADEDVTEEIRATKKPRPRRYKIQEVIKVRQIMLVQVVKEERGNKGAALTTYLSLAGRYCVLMPNTARGGGISRKITNASDRKKLKDIAGELSVPKGAGLIIRTAGSQRTKTEIKRDYEYLLRLWEQIREVTFKSVAPAPIYEEGDLIKRSIRDLYSKEIDEVLVEGERGYRVAKDFMKMIMPSHARNVKHYADSMPLYARYQVESYLGGMFNPVVQLKSGGYIVIGVTEALVAIDVNSGRATKEGSIEETALKTNLEAADEVARQLRLRDLAGLIVIDFIDMDERKNNSAVEKRLKDKLKSDRARIQVGRISGFGLMEMSRQRLRPGMLESTTQPCPHCHGTGLIRSDDSLALTILRAIEEEGTRKRSREVLVKAPVSVANFLMNIKREHIAGIEARYGLSVRVEADPALISPDYVIEKFKTATRLVPELPHAALSVDAELMASIDDEDDEDVLDQAEESGSEAGVSAEDETGEGSRSRRRRRRRRRKSGDSSGQDAPKDDAASADAAPADTAPDGDDQAPAENPAEAEVKAEEVTAQPEPEVAEERTTRRTSSRSRSRSPKTSDSPKEQQPETSLPEVVDLRDQPEDPRAEEFPEATVSPRSRSRKTAEKPAAETVKSLAEAAPEAAVTTPDATTVAEAAPEPAAVTEDSLEPASATPEAETPVAEEKPEADPAQPVADPEAPQEAEMAETAEEAARPKRRGWWSIGG